MDTMQKIIIGTSGHVDHGKSALAKELTGVDPDRLPEEKMREMTIDLGFVFFPLNEQEEVAIIDVPGHERFLKTMIAGAASIRMVLFVVAADEGIMPQTIEHLDVLNLLEIKKGIIIITKIDKVEKEYVEIVKEDIKKLTKGSFLENAPIFTVSSVTKQGIEELKTALKKHCSEIEPLPDVGVFRCPIDRIFSMKGFGSVVAGTVISGRLKKTENVEVLPIGKVSRIRNLQVHNQSVSEVFVGQRAAFNLADISIADIARGYELSIPDYLTPTTVIDTHLSLLKNLPKPLKQNQRIRLHKGTSEVMTRVRILDKDIIEPGGDGYVQLKLEKSVVGERGERFIIRSYSPMKVIGGGKFLSLYPVKEKRRSVTKRVEYLQKLESARDDDLVELVVLYAPQPIMYGRELMRLTNLPLSVIDNQVQKLLGTKKIIKLKDGSVVHERTLGKRHASFL
jgi:selenocysteine-specific elongation factor